MTLCLSPEFESKQLVGLFGFFFGVCMCGFDLLLVRPVSFRLPEADSHLVLSYLASYGLSGKAI